MFYFRPPFTTTNERTATMETPKTKLYSLSELSADNIDAWVEAISALADRYGGEVDGYNPDEDSPADFEADFIDIAEKHGIRFTEDGEIYEANN